MLSVLAEAGSKHWGNASSLHWAGRNARSALEESRELVATTLGVRPGEVYFTSGGTESNRLAILGALMDGPGRPRLAGTHAVVSAIEHPSVLDLCRQLEREEGLELTLVRPGMDGRVDPGEIISHLGCRTRLVSVLHANNETGVIQDVTPVARVCRERGITFHSDAVQSLGKIEVRPADLGADLLSLSAHKIGGPRGTGALWVRRGCGFRGPHRGGPQEHNLRPGTENLPGIMGFARALTMASPQGPELRDRLWKGIRSLVPRVALNGDLLHLLPNTLNLSFPGIPSELLLIQLDLEGLAASAGSACASGAREPSHVLMAMGLPAERVESAVRLSLGWNSTGAEVDSAVELIGKVVKDLKDRLGSSPRDSSASRQSELEMHPSASGSPPPGA